jgi:hypothetical protein
MAEPGRDANTEVPSSPPPSFTLLPDVAHHTIASFLPDKYMRTGNRLRVSEVYRALFDSYGGSLTSATLRGFDGGTDSELAGLLRRQTGLKAIYAVESAFVRLSQAIAKGWCRGVQCITLSVQGSEVDEDCLDILIGAIAVDGALPALKEIDFYSLHSILFLSKLARALKGGALPLLEKLRVSQKSVTEEDSKALADMVEARAGIPGCRQLQILDANLGSWLDGTSPSTQIRLVRALLPSLKDFGMVKWNDAFDPCFCDVRPQYLEALRIRVVNDLRPSHEVLEAVPALKVLTYMCMPFVGATAFQPVTDTLRRDVGLQNLRNISVCFCRLGDEHFRDF